MTSYQQKNFEFLLGHAQELERKGTDDTYVSNRYKSILEQLREFKLNKEQKQLEVRARQGFDRIYWKPLLRDPMQFIRNDLKASPYSPRLDKCYSLLEDANYKDAEESYTKLINEMLADKEVYKLQRSLLELSLAYEQLGQCHETLKNYPAALSDYLNAVHIDRDLFGPTGMSVTMDNYLKVCKNAELAGKLDFAEKTYSRLVELTKNDGRYQKINKEARAAASRLQKEIAQQASKPKD